MRRDLPPRHRGIILFSKGCPNPSFPLYVAITATAPAQAVAALARWQPPCQGAATPVAGAVTLLAAGLAAGNSPLRAPYSRPPLWALHCKRLCLRVVAAPAGWPQPTVPAGGTSARKHCPCGLLPPLAGTVGLPFGLALAKANRPLAGGLGRGLAVGGRPCMGAGRPSSSLPSLQKCSKNA
ncbi:hypothetical protein BHM03_00046799 [Ensete ventricosum]|nr:hypothetical protein BHM03_00046799 [Ensete ventricosum]